MDRHGGHLSVRRPRLQSGRSAHRADRRTQSQRRESLGQAGIRESGRQGRARYAQHQDRAAPPAAIRAAGRAGRAGACGHNRCHRAVGRMAGHQDAGRAAQRDQGAAAAGYRRIDGRSREDFRGIVLRGAPRVQAPRALLFSQFHLRGPVARQPQALQRAHRHGGTHAHLRHGLQIDIGGRCDHESLRNHPTWRQRRALERRGRQRVAAAPAQALSEIRLDQPAAAIALAAQHVDRDHARTARGAHVSADLARTRRGDRRADVEDTHHMTQQNKFGVALSAACLAMPCMLPAQTGAELKPITHETLWMMKRVGAPAASPDGKWVVYSVLEPSYEADKAVSDLWLAPADGGKAPRRITDTKAPEEDVAWSPDSGSIAFSTKREGDEEEQIYVLNLAEGGEARRVTNVST